ncbi:class I SAM-dependent methyltransferase [Pseudogemmobacter faecipullorum]|uniref:Methyltransferase domain-containing protein n=1 Tax=Pseudogemmobacter faecipullorum TaxID=2755041 RepID=A0ABS8CLD9_9RHOB|nr:class I SAM-dependent methyltransferase [Pseudogemmobacter faecipullorum]MCB5410156.1 hypothetical protein [Pseudogemmobacter faecipullorum]
MGISLIPGLFLARHAGAVAASGRGIILGRQKLHMAEGRRRRFLRALKAMGIALQEDEITQQDGFTEALFAKLGYPKIEALDFTDAEGAEHVHDLNLPCPDSLRGQFDLVIDGGTTEHIFHISHALETCHQLLRPGGVMMSYVAADGWFGHGFFQTGPDVPWRFWHHTLGYEMLEVSIAPRRSPLELIAIPDPSGQPRGGERALEGPHMILYACRRPLHDPPPRAPIQGHYL